MTTFAALLRSYRLRAGLGLRTFAGLIDERASTVSAIESQRRSPWRHPELLDRVADVLGIAESSELWAKICHLAQHPSEKNGKAIAANPDGTLLWWWTTNSAPPLEHEASIELADFLGFSQTSSSTNETKSEYSQELPALTELAIEWRVRRLLGRRNSQISSGPIDVESVLENEAGVRIEIVPGLIPRFSVKAAVVKNGDQLTFYVDRIVADSRPLSSYRHLLARCFAPISLWNEKFDLTLGNNFFPSIRRSSSWPMAQRDCDRFALALLLPANPVLVSSEGVYSEMVEQQGWIDAEEAARWVRNQLAERFAVPPTVVHKRLVGWPCHLYGRIAQALAAQEPTLPPTDWMVDDEELKQRTLFDLEVRQPV